jgi:hypothetical protein
MCGFGEMERVYFPDVFTGYFIDFYCLGSLLPRQLKKLSIFRRRQKKKSNTRHISYCRCVHRFTLLFMEVGIYFFREQEQEIFFPRKTGRMEKSHPYRTLMARYVKAVRKGDQILWELLVNLIRIFHTVLRYFYIKTPLQVTADLKSNI